MDNNKTDYLVEQIKRNKSANAALTVSFKKLSNACLMVLVDDVSEEEIVFDKSEINIYSLERALMSPDILGSNSIVLVPEDEMPTSATFIFNTVCSAKRNELGGISFSVLKSKVVFDKDGWTNISADKLKNLLLGITWDRVGTKHYLLRIIRCANPDTDISRPIDDLIKEEGLKSINNVLIHAVDKSLDEADYVLGDLRIFIKYSLPTLIKEYEAIINSQEKEKP